MDSHALFCLWSDLAPADPPNESKCHAVAVDAYLVLRVRYASCFPLFYCAVCEHMHLWTQEEGRSGGTFAPPLHSHI